MTRDFSVVQTLFAIDLPVAARWQAFMDIIAHLLTIDITSVSISQFSHRFGPVSFELLPHLLM